MRELVARLGNTRINEIVMPVLEVLEYWDRAMVALIRRSH